MTNQPFLADVQEIRGRGLEGILAVEEEHADDLASFLADLETTGGRGPETPKR